MDSVGPTGMLVQSIPLHHGTLAQRASLNRMVGGNPHAVTDRKAQLETTGKLLEAFH